MAKRSASKGLKYKRADRDLYETIDKNAVLPLLEHLPAGSRFTEPCAASGHLIRHLEDAGHVCVQSSDIVPLTARVQKMDAMTLTEKSLRGDFIITNTPWKREILHAMIHHFRLLAPTWVLFDADWQYTKQEDLAKRHNVPTVLELMKYCHKIVAVGRVCWIEGTKSGGTQDCAWYLFCPEENQGAPYFYPVGWKNNEGDHHGH